MEKTSKIAISIPPDVLKEVEKERKLSGESRSEIFRRAMELLLRRRRELELSKKYMQAYEQTPDSIEEVEAARSSAHSILSREPW